MVTPAWSSDNIGGTSSKDGCEKNCTLVKLDMVDMIHSTEALLMLDSMLNPLYWQYNPKFRIQCINADLWDNIAYI